jgi:hypothetical protein
MTVARPQSPRPPQARPQSTPRPPAQPGRPVAGATQHCPLQGATPCDPQWLPVGTRYGNTGERKLLARTRMRGAVPRGAPPDVAPLLRAYDLVIDTIAGYPSVQGGAPREPVIVGGRTQLLGHCSRSVHPRVAVDRIIGPTGEPHVQSNFMATPALMDRVPGTGIAGVYGFIVGLWPKRDYRAVVVRSVGCGKRAPGAGAAIGELNAMVRIFRAGNWSVKITLPPTGRFKLERGGTHDERAERARAAAAREAARAAGNVEQGWTARAYMREVREKISVTIKRNGEEIPAAQRITQLIQSIADFRDICTRIFVLLQSWPQFGWKFEGSISVLEGSLEARWEPELLTAPECGGRYLPVRTKIAFIARMKLIDAQATISFGVLANSETLRSRVEARISGTVGLSVTTEVNVPFAEHREPLRFGITSRGFVRARAVANATVLGRTFANAQATVEGAVALVNGVISVSENGVGFRGTLRTEAVKLEVEVSLGSLGPAKVEFEIFPQRDLMRWNEPGH